MMLDVKDDKEKRKAEYKRRIAKARNDRSHYAGRINEVFRYAQPDRMRVGNETSTPLNPDNQDEIFDEILQDVVEDFASDMVDLFTPKYRAWTAFKVKKSLSEGARREIQPALNMYSEHIFSAIRASNFYSALFDLWVDVSASCGGLCIPYPNGANSIVVHHVPLAQLVFDEGPHGVDGRWWEQSVAVRHLEAMIPDADWKPIKRKYPNNPDRMIRVTQGAVRDWDRLDEEVWKWHVIADGDLVLETEFEGAGSCPLIVTRWRRSAPSAWGMGPAARALGATRTLNKLAENMLKYTDKLVDPPHSYEEDMMQNYEQGVDAGTFVPRTPGSEPPVPLFRPGGEAQIAYFEQEDLRQRVRRALFQDKPVQRGDTPPTLGQWFDEKTTNNRRMENPRDRIVTEGVMQWINRFAWIEKSAGRLPEIKLDGQLVDVEIQSPLSKASDMEDVSTASQVLQIGASYLGQELPLVIDGAATILNVKEKLNDKLVAVRSQEEIAQILAARQQAGAA